MRLTIVAVLVLTALGWGAPAEGIRRRPTRCCVMVRDADGTERPYCFILNVRPARYGRRVCRLIGGVPQRHVAE